MSSSSSSSSSRRKRTCEEPKTKLLAVKAITISFKERKFLHIGCAWTETGYAPAAMIVCSNGFMNLSLNQIVGLVTGINDLTRFVGSNQRAAFHVQPPDGIIIKKTRCFSKSYLIINDAHTRLTLTEENLLTLEWNREAIVWALDDNAKICTALTEQYGTMKNAMTVEVINRYATMSVDEVYTAMMNHPVHGLPPREPSYYKEIAVIEYKRLCDEIWGENVNTMMMMPNSQWNLAELLDGYTDKSNDVFGGGGEQIVVHVKCDGTTRQRRGEHSRRD
ncbi:uncharacterized protein LOC126845231 [Adelges cooleyi]|uniref:uncharacterized protein LOC126845231 n=1 Tax=Adelges cooleyi TaxID=133065 RepID=UPI0021805254|nr:uncharacterized protein LOC126845231 [Adelges cooleyi]